MWGKCGWGYPGGTNPPIVVGGRRVDDEVLFAMPDERGLGQVDQVHSGTRRVRGDSLVAQVEAKSAGPRMAHDSRQQKRSGSERQSA